MIPYLLTAHLTPVCTARGRQRVSRAVGFPFRLRAGGIALAFRGCRDDLCLALRPGQFIELLLGVRLLDLFVLDGFLVGFIEADIRQSCLFQLHAVLGQPRGKRLLDIQFDLCPLPKHLALATSNAVFAFNTSCAASRIITLAKLTPMFWYTSGALSGRRR